MDSVMPEIIDAPEPEPDINPEVENEEIVDEPEPEILPEPVEKEHIPANTVFKDSSEPLPTDAPIIKKVRKKRTMTPEALEKLAKSRAKANETRKRNKELRMKGELPTPTQKKQIKIDKEIEAKKPVINNYETKNITNNITHEEIEAISMKATAKALDQYEKVRKERKANKKKVKEQEDHRTIVKHKINSAMRVGDEDFFTHCF